MLGSFALFTVIILALLWIFQTSLLGTFYRNIKIREIRSAAAELAGSIDQEDLSLLAEELSAQKQINILITTDYGKTVASAKCSPNSVIHNGWSIQYAAIYAETAQNGGMVFQQYNTMTHGAPQESSPENMVLAKTLTTQNGSPRLILLHSNLTPVDATVNTLRVQLCWITVVMLLLSSLLAFFLTSRITRPIVRINDAAKILGTGNYNVIFDESGYREISELAHTLNYTARELGKVESLRRELIANVSHDLRTPLTMISGYSEVMRDIPGENTPENIQIIIDEAKHLTGLVNDMLDLSKLQSGTQTLSISRFCLTDTLREIVNRYQKMADYDFQFESDGTYMVEADILKISQVIYNLINNAITHSGERHCITVRQSLHDHAVRVEIIDKGPGIPPEQLGEIWDRYYKANRNGEAARMGTGLGLSIVKAVLDLHNAAYGVQSEVGKGSDFWFELPCAPSEPKPLPPETPDASAQT